MTFRTYVEDELLLEGGAAVKGSSPITQAEVRKVLPQLLTKLAAVLKVPEERVRAVGSAGKKPKDSDESGDIDIAVQVDRETVEAALPKLAHDGKTFRAMRGINVYSFGWPLKAGGVVQVDVIPVENLSFAAWSYQANEEDLAQGLKGAHRNELFFAIAKHMPKKVTKKDESGEPLEHQRYFYDLGRGLMLGKQTRDGKKKAKKNFHTTEKHVVAGTPEKVVRLMFGKHATPKSVSTFSGALKALKSTSFILPDQLEKILDQAREGIRSKNLANVYL